MLSVLVVDDEPALREVLSLRITGWGHEVRTAGDVAQHLKLNMPNLKQAVAYWTAADGKLGKGADHTEIFRYAEMLAEEE